MTDIFLSPGFARRSPRAGGGHADYSMMDLSVAGASAMDAQANPDLAVRGHVIPGASISNIARELVFEAGLDPQIPAFSTVLACPTSLMGVVEVAGMIGRRDLHLDLVGGVETVSHVSLALKTEVADAVSSAAAHDPVPARARLGALTAADFDLLRGAWPNRQEGRSQGQHTEDTTHHVAITRAAQNRLAVNSRPMLSPLSL